MNSNKRRCVVCGEEKNDSEFLSAGRYLRRQCKVCFYGARSDKALLVGQRGRHRITGNERECNICHEVKPFSEFGKTSKGRPLARCKKCVNAQNKERWKGRRRKSVYANTSRRFIESGKLIYDYLVEHPCVDCGETNTVVLEFDHVRGDKIKSISQMRVRSKEVIMEEIEKCEVRCRNCHIKRHAREGNTLPYQLQKNGGKFDEELGGQFSELPLA